MLKIELVNQEDTEEMQEVIKFAESIGHRLARCQFPLYLVIKDGKKLGYFHNCVHAIIHPAMSEENSPRETYDMILEVVKRVNATGNSVAVMVPAKSNFTDEMLQKLGLYPTNHLLYTTEPPT